jgi:hypothetical protein
VNEEYHNQVQEVAYCLFTKIYSSKNENYVFGSSGHVPKQGCVRKLFQLKLS